MVLKKLSATALSQQFPFLLMLWVIFLLNDNRLVILLQEYCTPLSEWKIKFSVMALFSLASIYVGHIVLSVVISSLKVQPIIFLSAKSMMVVR